MAKLSPLNVIKEQFPKFLKGLFKEDRAALSTAADFTPVIGDIKGFVEAKTPLDYALAGVGLIPGVPALGGMVKQAPLKRGVLEALSKPEFEYAKKQLVDKYRPHGGLLGDITYGNGLDSTERGVIVTPHNTFRGKPGEVVEYTPTELSTVKKADNTVNLHTHPTPGLGYFSGSDTGFYRNTQKPGGQHVTGVIAPNEYTLVRGDVGEWTSVPQDLADRYGVKSMDFDPGVNNQSYEDWINKEVRLLEQTDMIRRAHESNDLDVWTDLTPENRKLIYQLMQQYRK